MAGNGYLKTLSFGMISAGVRLQSAARTVSVSLNGLHSTCFNDPEVTVTPRLNELNKCQACGNIVPKEERLSGYPLDGRYIQLTPEEIKAQLAMKDDVLTVQALVPVDTIPRLRLDKSYFMGPQSGPKIFKGAPVFTPQHRAFEMFREGLEKSGRAAIVTYAERGHEKIAVIFPQPVGCLMFEAFYDNEMPAIEKQYKDDVFIIPTLTTKEQGLGALLLQGFFTDEFDWSTLEDGYVSRVHALAVAKAEGLPIVIPDALPDPSDVGDLEAALEAALAAQSKPPVAMPATPVLAKSRKQKAA